jgi:protease secretion system outer membrane protein
MHLNLLRMIACLVCSSGVAAQSFSSSEPSAAPAPVATAPSLVGGLVKAFDKARQVDPLYLAGMAEFEGNKIDARAAGMAFLPQVTLASSQLQNESGGRRSSLTVSQPLLDIEKLATWRSQDPKDLSASAQFAVRQADLAQRLFSAYSSGLLALEGLAQGKVRSSALDQQVKSAKRLLELSRGTVTDVRDAQVKFLRAKSDELKFRADLEAAQRLYLSIVGETPVLATPALLSRQEGLTETLLADVRRSVTSDQTALDVNPEVVLARQQGKLAELEAYKAKYAWMPLVSGTYTASSLDGNVTKFTGITLSMPLEAGDYYKTKSAAAAYVKVAQEVRDKERQVALNIDQLRTTLQLGISELVARQTAVEAAELSVTANDKSFKGGVRTMVDVLNSIEVLYTVKSELVQTVLAFADKLLQLRLAEGKPASDVLAEVESFLAL